MTSFKFLSAALVFSALLATPALAWDPGNAEAADPTFSIYSGIRQRSPADPAAGPDITSAAACDRISLTSAPAVPSNHKRYRRIYR